MIADILEFNDFTTVVLILNCFKCTPRKTHLNNETSYIWMYLLIFTYILQICNAGVSSHFFKETYILYNKQTDTH